MTFEEQLKGWWARPLESRAMILNTLRDMATDLRQYSVEDAETVTQLVDVMQAVPPQPREDDIEWLTHHRSKALEALQADIVLQADEVKETAALWSAVDADGLDP